MTEYKGKVTVASLWEAERNRFNRRLLAEPSFVTEVANNIMTKIVDEFILDIVIECRRAVKMDYIEFLPVPKCENRTANEIEFEVNLKTSKKEMIICPSCSKMFLPTNFGKHLATCMGIVRRQSLRLAAANINKDAQYSSLSLDDDDDEELTKPPKPAKKVVKRKHNKKRVRGEEGSRVKSLGPVDKGQLVAKCEPEPSQMDVLASSLVHMVDLDLLDIPSLTQEDDLSLDSPVRKKSK